MISPTVDALAAACSGVGVALMALQVKPTPSIIREFLPGPYAALWAVLLLIGSLCAMLGAATRTRKPGRRQTASYGLELIGWPIVAWATFIFLMATAHTLGLIPALLTIGYSGFVIITCVGHWWTLREARRAAEGLVRREASHG